MAKNNSKEKKPKEKKNESLSALQKEVYVVMVLVLAVLFGLSYINKAGLLGSLINHLVFGLIGGIAYILPFYMIGFAFFYLANRENPLMVKKCYCSVFMMVLLMAVFHLFTYEDNRNLNVIEFVKDAAVNHRGGGLIGGILANVLACICDEMGAYVVLAAMFAVAFMYMTEKLLFHNLSKKSKVMYKKMRQKAEDVAEERALERQKDELDELEEWEDDRPKLRLPFFNFKKELADNETEENRQDEDDLEVFGDMKEITVNEPEEAGEEGVDAETETGEDESESDPFAHLVIQRADEQAELDTKSLEEMPIHQQELQQKFAEEEENAEDFTDFTVQLDAEDMSEMQDFDIQKGETGEGIVMDAVEDATLQSPEAVMRQLKEPVAKGNGTSKKQTSKRNGVTTGDEEVSEGNLQITPEKTVAKKEQNPYCFPTTDLLSKPDRKDGGVSDDALKESARKLQTTLESFGVGAKVTNISCGPTVTRFELQPDQGVKVSKITALADDIKLNMAAEEIRIEAPIPGKAAVGIEVPNESTSMVHFRDLVENVQFQEHKSKLCFAVGKDIGGQVVVTDIAKMPHLLIAGATGSGKSVCINTLIMSILYKAKPDEVKLIMIDPKVVELSCYKGIPHLLIPVVTDPKKASAALQWAVQEMTERYKKFADLGVREINGYNERIKAVEYAEDERYQKLPQIVIIVDELADLMMVASKEVEEAICRLAQLARAAGIHLVIATQRPSVNVITGLIKANVPSRIAFAVSSAVDSRTILDGAGAEKLLGKGDMLFYPSGFPKPVRVQGAFISDEEVSRVVSYIIEQNELDGTINSAEIEAKMQAVSTMDASGNGNNTDNDDYFEEAGKFIIEKNKASIGMLQRVYKIGFNRAARIMDQLCAAGVVGPEEGTKPRKILMTIEEFEEYIAQ